MNLKKIVINRRKWIDTAQDRLFKGFVNAALNLRVSLIMEWFSQLSLIRSDSFLFFMKFQMNYFILVISISFSPFLSQEGGC
jgi:hypothetical protein